MSILVLGVDPGFASVGLALVRLHSNHTEVMRLDVLRTQKSDKKRQVRASDDNLRRARELAYEIRKWLVGHPSRKEPVSVICAESMSFPRHAGNAAKMAMCWGVIAALAERRGLPIVQASPQEIKKSICGRKDASKEDIERALRDRFRIKPSMLGDFPNGQSEHAFDALASVIACLQSDVVRMARQMIHVPKNGVSAES